MLHKRALNDFCGFFAFCSKQQKHFVWGYYNGVRADHFSGGSSMWDGLGWEECGVRFVEDVWIVWRPCVFVVYLRNQPRKTPKRQPNMRLCSGKLRKYRKECEEHGCTYRSMLISLPMLRCSSAFRNFVENLWKTGYFWQQKTFAKNRHDTEMAKNNGNTSIFFRILIPFWL